LIGVVFTMGESLAARFGQATVCQSRGPQIPNADFAVLMAAMR
jgi:hypothetical protein